MSTESTPMEYLKARGGGAGPKKAHRDLDDKIDTVI